MSMAQHNTRTLGEFIGGWWRNWKQGHAILAEIDALERGKSSHIPRGAGVNSAKPRTVAGKWPDSADLLSRRLAELQLTGDAARAEPERSAGRLDHPDSK